MIAQRFRALGWVGGIASAATGLYLISLQVAAERARLEDVDKRIVSVRREMRQLQTELGTRGSLRQLERFNSETLALAAPRAAQYLHGDAQFASLTLRTRPASVVEPTAAVVTAAASHAPAAVPAIVERAPPAPPPVQRAAFVPEHRAIPHFERAAFVPAPHAIRVAMMERAVIDRSTLGDLARTAAQEDKRRP